MAKNPRKTSPSSAKSAVVSAEVTHVASSPDVRELTSDLEKKFGEGLSQSFDLLGRGLLTALSETRGVVDRLQAELRAQSVETGAAVGNSERLAETLRTLSKELNDRLSDEHLRERIEQAAVVASAGLKMEFSEELERLKAEQEALSGKYARVSQEQGFLEDIVDENRDMVRRFRPGHIEVLEQKLSALEDEKTGLHERLTEANSKLDAAQRHNHILRSQDDVGEREEIGAKLEKLAKLREELDSAASMRAERDELRERLQDLEKLRERYESSQKAVERDRQLLADLREERATREALAEKYRAEKHERAEQTKKVRRLETQVEHLRQRSGTAETSVGELERELESFRDGEAQVEEKRQEYLDSLQEQKERKTAIEEELAGRTKQLTEQAERALAAEREQLRAVVERELKREHQAELSELDRLKKVDEQFGALLDDYRKATEERVTWERDRATRAAAVAAEEERIRQLQDQSVDKDVALNELKDDVAAQEKAIAERRVDLTELEATFSAQEERYQNRREELESDYEERRATLEARYSQNQQEFDDDHDTRIAPIHAGAFDLKDVKPMPNGISESLWLDGIVAKIEAADFYFPRRLVDAFHTSLKIATWAPLTVLAGVSGTGKSELPRLYAMFGGLHHKMLSVQPNWDSPQDLFGFFNYMDSRYKATELLQALVQSQKSPDKGGFSDQLLLVLLDEMNLARVELYFSEFLSKLEARRGLEAEKTPYIGVDIGSGFDEEQVVLGDNVLFVGTMNEDETTNTLSDKVLDRGNVITFPRPTNLRSRALGQPLQSVPGRLSVDTWKSWSVSPDAGLPEDVRQKIGAFMDGINAGLSEVHRAMGHRVLQATENYVANHPDVRASKLSETNEDWQRALGDQVVQKVMPKLRGVETDTQRGRACLDAVERLLHENTPELSDDFKAAREAGYGSFVWSSSAYLTRK